MRIANKTEGQVQFVVDADDTDQLRRILVEILPGVLDDFARKNRAYGENTFPLGAAGQFPEIDRKVRLLKAAIWDNRETATDIAPVADTVGDLIGHLLMLLDCLENFDDV